MALRCLAGHDSRMLIKVAIVEDNIGIRSNWAKVINASTGFLWVGTCGSAEEALKQMREFQPDVVLMDINLPGMAGLECTARLKELMALGQNLVVPGDA